MHCSSHAYIVTFFFCLQTVTNNFTSVFKYSPNKIKIFYKIRYFLNQWLLLPLTTFRTWCSLKCLLVGAHTKHRRRTGLREKDLRATCPFLDPIVESSLDLSGELATRNKRKRKTIGWIVLIEAGLVGYLVNEAEKRCFWFVRINLQEIGKWRKRERECNKQKIEIEREKND